MVSEQKNLVVIVSKLNSSTKNKKLFVKIQINSKEVGLKNTHVKIQTDLYMRYNIKDKI